MKRGRETVEILDIDHAKYLMLQSLGFETKPKLDQTVDVFECKTCHRRFPSFQALGGHRASHKRSKLMASFLGLSSTNPKIHDCSICGQQFSKGQALGGHMRRHRVTMNESFSPFVPTVPILKRSNSCRRVVCLDLNLTPFENDLQLLFGNKAPKVDLCI